MRLVDAAVLSAWLAAVAIGVGPFPPGWTTSAVFAAGHRDAPAMALDPAANITDLFAFRSYENDPTPKVTLILSVHPFLETAASTLGTPFDPTVLYEIHVDNNDDAVADLTLSVGSTSRLVDVTCPYRTFAFGLVQRLERLLQSDLQQPILFDEASRAELLSLCADLNTVWHAPTTTNEDRKELLRVMISSVRIEARTTESVHVIVEWADGTPASLLDVPLARRGHRKIPHPCPSRAFVGGYRPTAERRGNPDHEGTAVDESRRERSVEARNAAGPSRLDRDGSA